MRGVKVLVAVSMLQRVIENKIGNKRDGALIYDNNSIRHTSIPQICILPLKEWEMHRHCMSGVSG